MVPLQPGPSVMTHSRIFAAHVEPEAVQIGDVVFGHVSGGSKASGRACR